MDRIRIPPVLRKMSGIFSSAGFSAYLVGGAVRDMLMGGAAHDYDIATDATPRQVMSLFRSVIPTGIAHGTVTVHFMGHEIECTTFRTESGYSDGRHPDSVAYASSIEQDLSRRDFTMNAIAADLSTGTLIDPFDGRGDIMRKLIRCVGAPCERFIEDGLRPVRALRFSAQLGFRIDGATFDAITAGKVQERIRAISVERFRDEFCRIMLTGKPSQGMLSMERTGILAMFMPELAACRGVEQRDSRGYHIFDVFDHNVYACDGAPEGKLLVRIAALLHDVGKPDVRTVTTMPDGSVKISFHGHEVPSARKARALLTRLRFSNADTDRVCHLIENHMFYYDSTWSDAAVRRFLAKVGADCIEDQIDLRLSDMYGKYNRPVRTHDNAADWNLAELRERVLSELRKHAAVSLRDLAVTGRDLMEAGIPEGRMIGQILRELLQAVIDDPSQNTKEALLLTARRLYERATP